MRPHTTTTMIPAFHSMQQKNSEVRIEDSWVLPEIILNPEEERFSIEGTSYPKQSKEFFSSVFLWLEIYALNPKSSQMLEVDVQAFNSSSALFFLKVFQMWQSIDPGNGIIWTYDAEDEWMKEAGEEYRQMVGERFYMKRKAANETSEHLPLLAAV